MKDTQKDKPRVKKLEKEKMLSLRTSQGVLLYEIGRASCRERVC